MPLDGVNKLCASCNEDCEQFKQVTVVHCPRYAKSLKVTLDPEQKLSHLTQAERI